MEQRLQKLFSGLCSRRKAEAYIAAGRVSVNGKTAVLGQKADPERDAVLLDGNPLPGAPSRKRYLLLYKPRGFVTTLSDERGRRTVADLVRDCGERVYPVGRLDRDSEGLLLLTSDGALARRLTHPGTEIEKAYEVSVTGTAEALGQAAERLSAVRDLDGERIRPAAVSLLRRDADAALLSVTIHEGKKRQIRRMCQQCGLTVMRLRRVREHCLTLEGLRPGQWRELRREEVAALREGPEKPEAEQKRGKQPDATGEWKKRGGKTRVAREKETRA